MSPEQIQRTIDFILRSQANAVIRMERWEEQHEEWKEEHEKWEVEHQRRMQEIEEEMKKAVAAIKRAFFAIEQVARVSRRHEKKIETLGQSTSVVKRRSDDMKQLMKMAMRLLAHQSKRLDALESTNNSGSS